MATLSGDGMEPMDHVTDRFTAMPGRIGQCFRPSGFWIMLFLLSVCPVWAVADPVAFTDDQGRSVVVRKVPERVVSLVPSITEILFAIGAGDAVAAVTHHSTRPSEVYRKTVVGGFFSPSLRRIEAIKPDVIFYAALQKPVAEKLEASGWLTINLEIDTITDSYATIRLLGRIFNRERAAADIVADNERLLDTVSRKIARIPPSQRKRVIRLMGRDRLMTPGDDSFQNELIRAAGGVPPILNQDGDHVPVSIRQWQTFDPQFIYGCAEDRRTAQAFLYQPGWQDVAAVRNRTIRYFPCELTCRCATHTGYFVAWLSSSIYRDLYGEKTYRVHEDRVREIRELALGVSYVARAVIATSTIDDFDNKTLMVDFTEPMTVVSTLEGTRNRITTVGNHYSSPPCWQINHRRSLTEIRSRVLQVVGRSAGTAAFLFTGADMDHLAVETDRFRDMQVHALVTAGVSSNAIRTSKDTGTFYEPGTINIILLPNMGLTERAMTRALITATEAKTAALLDMDIRSAYSPTRHRATGTGTDNIIVVQGIGTPIDNSGGHTKMGELIARAVYRGVRKAVGRQNGLVPGRHVFRRLHERGITLFGLTYKPANGTAAAHRLTASLEQVLLDPRWAEFVLAGLALSDEYEKGLVRDLTVYENQCRLTAEAIAGGPIPSVADLLAVEDLPPVLAMTLNAVLNGARHRMDSASDADAIATGR